MTVVTFDSAAHLHAWRRSEQRADLISQSKGFAHDSGTCVIESGFEGWFDLQRSPDAKPPPPWKFNYLILVGLYPIVMIEILYLNNKLLWMNVAFSNLIGNILSVALLGWPVLAILSKSMRWWLQPGSNASRWTDIKGALVMIAVLGVLVALFYVLALAFGFSSEVTNL
ncbi:MAG: hypothetical protein WBB15_02000 [Ornithinimicrobium sp.]